ncbi:hypothetical protein PVAG01_09038 [Phlyctema vagabunda]|uniref:Roadblock/LAMTOR2 domain-containing protein n=1 Tax=Phlyctema vagabunda TaxID=108571 RepID=A0ABR4P679_9HELO
MQPETSQWHGAGTDITSEDNLLRLSQKASVQAVAVLDRSSGSILRTQGQFATSRVLHAGTTSMSASTAIATGPESNGQPAALSPSGVEELASMAWNFVNATSGLVQGLDTEDEVKLLRLRTKKHELVIVPDPKYILVVVHETPSA